MDMHAALRSNGCTFVQRLYPHSCVRNTTKRQQTTHASSSNTSGGGGSMPTADHRQPSSTPTSSSPSTTAGHRNSPPSSQEPRQHHLPSWDQLLGLGKPLSVSRKRLACDERMLSGGVQWLTKRQLAARGLSSAGGGRAAAMLQAFLDEEVFHSHLQALAVLLPAGEDGQGWTRWDPQLLARILAEPPSVLASRLVQLERLLHGADVGTIVRRRPSLLLEEEYLRVPQGLGQLRGAFPGQDVVRAVAEQPALLVQDIQQGLARLKLWFPTASPSELLLRLVRMYSYL